MVQDNLCRIVLRERDWFGAVNVALFGLRACCVLDARYHVVVEGILCAVHYGAVLAQLRADHCGPAHGDYSPFTETLARHARRRTLWPSKSILIKA
ncbi:hypothetical protein ACFVFJ_48190 [Streptomyces sp. NPDC057717]|uniref:hypothetical protein n=1 Tax=Streptomyces sp. NPDC057717 TaxID=3346224 RepID=UPI0036BB1ACB